MRFRIYPIIHICAVILLVHLKKSTSIRIFQRIITNKPVPCCTNQNDGNLRSNELNRANVLREILDMRTENLRASKILPESDPVLSASDKMGVISPLPFIENDDNLKTMEEQKAYACSKLPCTSVENSGAVCACNFKTGNVVSFKNECDVKKHNCRYETGFKVILNEVCPWQFESRRSMSEHHFDYTNPSYYN